MKKGITITQRFKLDNVTSIDNLRDAIFTYKKDDKEGSADTDYLLIKKLSDSKVTFDDGKFVIPLSQADTLKLTRIYYVEAQLIYSSGATNKWNIERKSLRPTLRTENVNGESDGEEVEDIDMTIDDVFINGGGGTTDDYNDLTNKPRINNTELIGNKTDTDLGLATKTELNAKQNTITGGNGIDVSSDVVSVDLKKYIDRQYLKFTDGKLDVDLLDLGKTDLRTYLTTNYQELGEPTPLVNKTYVDNLMSGAVKRLVVQQLPTKDIDTNTIYMILKSVPSTNNIYDEYMYINNAWELIGSTEVDLSNYYTKTESDNRYNAKLTADNGITIGSDNAIGLFKNAPQGITNYLTFYQGGVYIDTYSLSHDSDFRSGLTSDAYNNPLQPLITTTSKLSADKVNDSNTTNKFVPTHSSTESGKVLGVDSNGDLEWTTKGSGGSYSGGDGIDITNDTISVDLKSGTELQITSGELDIDLSNYATTSSVSGKEDKTTISTDTTSTTVSLTLADNHEYRFTQDLTSLTLTMPNGDFISSIVFASGSTPTSMTYDSNIKWSGDDVTNGQFVPSADKDYDITMYYNGLNINGIVRGV